MKSNFFAIERIDAVVPAGRNAVNARIIDNGNSIETHDSHKALGPGYGQYTVPIDGIYRVSSAIHGNHYEQIVVKRAGDVIDTHIKWDNAYNGDLIFCADIGAIGIYRNSNIEVLDAWDMCKVGLTLPLRSYHVIKIPRGSSLEAVTILYGKASSTNISE